MPLGLTSETIHDVVNILKTDGLVVRDWEQVCGGLNIQDAADMDQWRLRYNTGAITSYELFRGILATWVSVRGSGATMATLSSVLAAEGFAFSAERISQRILDGATIVNHGPSPHAIEAGGHIPSTSQGAQGPRNFTPRNGRELELTLANCKDGDTISLARDTKYIGQFNINKSNITLRGLRRTEILCEDKDAVAVYIFGDSCILRSLRVVSKCGTCILVAGNNNTIDNCKLVSLGEGSAGLVLRGRSNNVEKVDIPLDGWSTTESPQIGLQVEGTDIFCSAVTVMAQTSHRPHSAYALVSSTLSERMRLENCRFRCGPRAVNKIEGNSHSMKNVDFTSSVAVSTNGFPVQMERCSATKLEIGEGGKIDWVDCKFQHIPDGIMSSGSAL